MNGKETAEIKSYELNELEMFGTISDDDVQLLQAVIRQAMIKDYIAKEIENYGVLKITKAGKAYLDNPKSFKITKDNEFNEEENEIPQRIGGSLCCRPRTVFDVERFTKKCRNTLNCHHLSYSKTRLWKQWQPPTPFPLKNCKNIPGVGQGKAKRYGDDFIKLIKTHVEENDIERPEDLRVRTVANKSKLKISIIQAIDRKVALDDLAESRSLEIEELLDEIDAIVYSGTKLTSITFGRDNRQRPFGRSV